MMILDILSLIISDCLPGTDHGSKTKYSSYFGFKLPSHNMKNVPGVKAYHCQIHSLLSCVQYPLLLCVYTSLSNSRREQYCQGSPVTNNSVITCLHSVGREFYTLGAPFSLTFLCIMQSFKQLYCMHLQFPLLAHTMYPQLCCYRNIFLLFCKFFLTQMPAMPSC